MAVHGRVSDPAVNAHGLIGVRLALISGQEVGVSLLSERSFADVWTTAQRGRGIYCRLLLRRVLNAQTTRRWRRYFSAFQPEGRLRRVSSIARLHLPEPRLSVQVDEPVGATADGDECGNSPKDDDWHGSLRS
jgi:hypothetical protein